MLRIESYIVDSFTDIPFKGNPAGVCILEENLSENKMLTIAKELGYSETAFIKKNKDTFSIRYFSPLQEIPLCGHATLAASKIVFEKNSEINKIHFVTIQGIDLLITKEEDNILMEFPVYDTHAMEVPDALIKALGIHKIANSVYNTETNIIVLEIDDVQVLQNLKPNFEALIRSHDTINGVLVTATSNKENFDFESRYFWPWSGTNEDPVTGGTHTFLAKYWADRLQKNKLNSFQCSERSGFMEVELIGGNKLVLKSKAQIVFEGFLRIEEN